MKIERAQIVFQEIKNVRLNGWISLLWGLIRTQFIASHPHEIFSPECMRIDTHPIHRQPSTWDIQSRMHEDWYAPNSSPAIHMRYSVQNAWGLIRTQFIASHPHEIFSPECMRIDTHPIHRQPSTWDIQSRMHEDWYAPNSSPAIHMRYSVQNAWGLIRTQFIASHPHEIFSPECMRIDTHPIHRQPSTWDIQSRMHEDWYAPNSSPAIHMRYSVQNAWGLIRTQFIASHPHEIFSPECMRIDTHPIHRQPSTWDIQSRMHEDWYAPNSSPAIHMRYSVQNAWGLIRTQFIASHPHEIFSPECMRIDTHPIHRQPSTWDIQSRMHEDWYAPNSSPAIHMRYSVQNAWGLIRTQFIASHPHEIFSPECMRIDTHPIHRQPSTWDIQSRMHEDWYAPNSSPAIHMRYSVQNAWGLIRTQFIASHPHEIFSPECMRIDTHPIHRQPSTWDIQSRMHEDWYAPNSSPAIHMRYSVQNAWGLIRTQFIASHPHEIFSPECMRIDTHPIHRQPSTWDIQSRMHEDWYAPNSSPAIHMRYSVQNAWGLIRTQFIASHPHEIFSPECVRLLLVLLFQSDLWRAEVQHVLILKRKVRPGGGAPYVQWVVNRRWRWVAAEMLS